MTIGLPRTHSVAKTRHFGDESEMAALLGRIEEFDGSKEADWQQYVERLAHFFTANGITDADKKRAVFLSVIGAATYKTLRNILSPAKPGDKTYEELIEKLSRHFRPAPSEIVERFKFHSRSRLPGESVATFVAELRSLSEFCNFGDTLDVMIRDRLVCGINDITIQKRLLSEPGLTYAKAVEIAQSAETAAQSLRELRGKRENGAPSGTPRNQSPQQEGVHRASEPQPTRKSTLTCYRCGRAGHTVTNCKVDKDVECHQCGKKGHMKRACRGKPRSGQRRPGRKQVKKVEDDKEEESDSDDSSINHLSLKGTKRAPPITVDMKVDNCLITMEVDTGASLSLMSYNTFSGVWPGRSLESTDVRLLPTPKSLSLFWDVPM